jgi:acyl-CoA thioesterase-1
MRLFQITFPATASSQVQARSYGAAIRRVQALIAAVGFVLALFAAVLPARAQQPPVKLVLLGDSLTAGLGLPAAQAFPSRLAGALKTKGLAVDISDAGVSGDTSSTGLARLDWAVPEGTDAVIVELGANDALRGVDPKITRAALDKILGRLKERGIEVLLTGMQAPRNLGSEYARGFDGMYADLAQAHGALLYPFFLDGVVTDAKLNQHDGIHPNAAGVDVIVERILPKVEELITRVRAKSPS